jgi:hypothetical protein
MKITLLTLGLLGSALVFEACGEVTAGPTSRSVGAACTTDAQCAQTCLIDERHFPGGMCTLACASNADCPGGSVCLSEESGVCVVACATDADCAPFGRGFVCDQDELQSGGGTASICRVP